MIQLNNIHKYYAVAQNKLHVLKGINLHIGEGELVSIMGPSGSGKSTLLNILGILDDYDTGDYYLAGTHIKKLSQTKAAYYRNKFLGFVFQSFNLLSFKNAMENVALPLYYQQVGRRERNKLALEYLDRVGLKDWAEHSPNEMSGGQRQRVAIARALVNDPSIILADEPTGNLDTKTSYEIMDLFENLYAKGNTIIMVTHEEDIAKYAHRIVRLRDGLIESDQLNSEVATHQEHA